MLDGSPSVVGMPRSRIAVLSLLAAAALAACSSSASVAPLDSGSASGGPASAMSASPDTSSPSPTPTVPSTPRIVALGDSYTAGFGYYDDGVEWDDLFACTDVGDTPVKNNPCSSNSTLRTMKGDLQFAPDYGFANQVSWAAQVATALGITAETAADLYANVAVSGSTAKEWADDKLVFEQFDGANGLDAVASLDPDIVLMTLGGNPTLSKVLLGGAEKCKTFDKPLQAAGLSECFGELIAEDATVPSLVTVYERLLDSTDAEVMVLTYPQVIPQLGLTLGGWSPEALLLARDVLNASVMSAVEQVRTEHSEGARLLTADPEFGVGLPPGDFTSESDCFGRAKKADGTDGPSNQSVPTQELFAEDYDESGWCAGPAWTIASDTGVHPNITGYAELARVAVDGLGGQA